MISIIQHHEQPFYIILIFFSPTCSTNFKFCPPTTLEFFRTIAHAWYFIFYRSLPPIPIAKMLFSISGSLNIELKLDKFGTTTQEHAPEVWILVVSSKDGFRSTAESFTRSMGQTRYHGREPMMQSPWEKGGLFVKVPLWPNERES